MLLKLKKLQPRRLNLEAEILAYARDHSDKETALQFNVSPGVVRRIRRVNNFYRPRALIFPKVFASKFGHEKAQYLESERTRRIYAERGIKFL